MTRLAVLLHQMLSGENALDTTAVISQFYRTPGSAGYHAATNYVKQKLADSGFDLDVTTYPIDGQTTVLDQTMPLAWEPYGATVRVVNPDQVPLVDFGAAPTCLNVWSHPTPPGGMTADVVSVGTGLSESDWAQDLQGKVAFIRHTEHREAWKHAAQKALDMGAAGVLTDYLLYSLPPYRSREQLPEAVQFLRLPNSHDQYKAWGCSLSHHAAQRLEALLALGPVTIHADIRCRSFEGYGQNVIATIPGRELPDESVLVLAHTTGTKPGANCAAGDALLIEIARVLQALIARGEIPRPRRTIKFMVIVEGLGSQMYIAEHQDELPRIKAAICLDSVGNHQEKLKSTLFVSRHPDSSPSFINDYWQTLIERAPQDTRWVGRNDAGMSKVVFTSQPYTPWSDNNRWASFGIPSPLIMSTQSIHFHTQFLTADMMDPVVFHRAGVSTALGLYEIADAGQSEALLIARDVAASSVRRLTSVTQQALRALGTQDGPKAAAWALRRLTYLAERDCQAVTSTLALVPGEPPEAACQQIAEHVTEIGEQSQHCADTIRQALAARS